MFVYLEAMDISQIVKEEYVHNRNNLLFLDEM